MTPSNVHYFLVAMRKPLLVVGIAVAALALPASAQPVPGGPGAESLQRQARIDELQKFELDNRYRANEGVPAGQRVLFDYGVFLQFSYLSLDDALGANHGLRQYDVVPYVRFNIDGAQELFLRGRFGYRDFNYGDSFDGRGDEPIDGDLDRGYYSFDTRRYNAAYNKKVLGADPSSDFNFVFKGGRDLTYWANGLVLGTTLDGITVTLEKGALGVDVIAGITPIRTVDFDSSRPGFDYNTRRGFYGAIAKLNAGDHQPFLYGLIQRDYNEMDTLDLGLIQTDYEYNSWYIGFGSTGALGPNLRYGIEFAYEGGTTLSNSFEASGAGGLFPIEQTEDKIAAAALDIRLDYFFNDRRQTRLSFEFLAATGDKDRGTSTNTFNGNASGTEDHGFNAFGLINTGLALAPDPSNLLLLRFGVATLPLPDHGIFSRMQIGVDFFVINKLQAEAPIDQVTSGEHRFLGVEPDLYLNWQVTSDLTLALRYGVFFPNSQAFGANDEPRQFFYGGLTFSF
ncbi:hypothetical protein [Humisphaera borealis]|uniref:Alginate export domain-containing protein n=1 Tax=Humisphaera borealis TaxID=2807512 RepID=A0A7M2WPF6_9BACT|nr:hypothetical protein [Humisphaera borealis]QOV87346.1 hypothetical protein IPV69_13705 [Humisphaera borealis]